MKLVPLKPVTVPPTLASELEREILRAVTREIYSGLLSILRLKPKVIKNEARDYRSITGAAHADIYKIGEALRAGTLTYDNGLFSGSLDAGLTKALKAAGATWDRHWAVFRLPEDALSPELSQLISSTRGEYQERVGQVKKYLDALDPEAISGKVAVNRLFENAIKKTEKTFQQNVAAITLTTELSDEQRTRIIATWKENANHSIKGLVEDQIIKLKGRVAASVQVGTRYSNLVKGIQAEYGVSQSRARLIARQESKSLVNSYAETRYEDAGVQEYKWKAVHGTAAHPVRPIHQALNDASEKHGKTYRFDDPPIVDETGRRANPGFDFNCRCRAIPIVRFGGK
jgi:SPP1 gp7 family putative phage head morphogenesis protein